ncbi:MAG: YCF48-related protein [Bacteroidales bacterium]|nr:YCF48-related protein [Bacteroidales bacterium]
MKNLLPLMLICLLLIGVSGISQPATWEWQNPVPTGNPLDDIHVFDTNSAIIVGQSGTILKTTDGGITWSRKVSGTTVWLHSVHFVDNNTGWVVGFNGTILKTTDGGTNWTNQSDPFFTDNLTSVYFINADTGWFVSASGGTKKTTDGGLNWNFLSGSPGGSDIQFIDNDRGWVASGGYIYRTINGGLTWDWALFYNSSAVECHSIHFIDSNTGWAVGGDQVNGLSLIAHTTDGGLTWVQQTSGVQDMLYSVYFTDANTGWTVGTQGGLAFNILNTVDGGANWNLQASFATTAFPKSVSFTNANTGWVVGEGGRIYKTSNGGVMWSDLKTSVTADNQLLYSVDFENTTTGWAVGGLSAGKILKTMDGGTTWFEQASIDTINQLKAVQFIDQNTGWTVGSSGTILKTTDGGTNWVTQTSGITNALNTVFFLDGTTGWAGGLSGKILKTTNGGDTWVLQSSGVTANINSIYFIDNLTGFAAGSSGKVLKTTNGGTTWTNQTVGTTTIIYYSLNFTDNVTGWLVGSSGRIYKTTNAGATWVQQNSGTSSALYYVKPGQNIVRAFGSGGTIRKTTDGGTTWVAEVSGTVTSLWSASFLNDSTGWLVGSNGTILHKGVLVSSPAAYAVTGGGSYCAGESGLPVGLANSETGVTYILFKDNVAQVPTIPGTGSAFSFGNQTAGAYTVEGTNSTGTTPMTGIAVITETPALAVSVTISADVNPVPVGNEVTLTALPVNGGATPSYQWMVNGINAGTDNAVVTYIPANNDAVTCTMTSDETCTTGNPAISNEIILSVIPATVSLLNIVVADGETTCYNALQTIYVAGNGNTFTVQAGGSATMIAGQNIIYLPGTTTDSGSYMLGYITTDDTYCTNPVNPVANSPVQHDGLQTLVHETGISGNIRLYPNPATSSFTLELTGNETTGLSKLEIYNISGLKVFTKECNGVRKQSVSVSDLRPGVYFIHVTTGGGREALKLIKL